LAGEAALVMLNVVNVVVGDDDPESTAR